MKVISIIQPWATLIALGEKKFETRSWATKHRGQLAIHASKKVDKDAWTNEAIYMTLRKHGILTVNDFPIGAIIATSHLTDCHSVHKDHSGNVALLAHNGAPVYWLGKDSNEFLFGDYSHGRFAWELADIVQIKPIPAKGQLGLWNYHVGEK